jgi:hypothetical protein
MQRFFRRLDEIANIQTENRPVLWLERIAFFFLTVMVLFAPHSIAVTQSAWLIGMLAWVIRLFFKPRPKLKPTAIDYALWAFLLWSVVSSVFSYAPDISLDKLRGVSLFLIFYFVYNNVRTRRGARFLALALIFSASIVAAWMPVERFIGRGVEVHGLAAESPLLKAAPLSGGIPISQGKTVVWVGKRKIYSPEGLLAEIEKSDASRLTVYHEDFYSVVEIKRADLLNGSTAAEKLGIGSWKRNHNWRAAGFYGENFMTFSEVIQLIISLAFGIFIALLARFPEFSRSGLARSPVLVFLLVCLALMGLALLLTVTRASQFAFFVSAVLIVLLGGSRKIRLIFAVVALPLVIIGLLVFQQTRNIGFNLGDKSTQYSTMMWRDGMRLWTSSARNFTLGVGMDSIKRYWREWDLFDRGFEPMGHFHSTPVQLLVERGLPALLIWLTILGVYARTLWRRLKLRMTDDELRIEEKSQIETGIVLGCLGGLAGFFTSGLVHYNLGDGEVAMVFYILMGLSVFVCHAKRGVETETEEISRG